ncbi:hypothetical protein D7Y11_31935, partial [Corallococcus sp. AB018]|uniref:histidine kinase dimerization/phospho-acceptor domain-containing protein n=1 Tax=Corallococcus sp. AB018 TaxID=2316715 RepID=UPI000FAFBE86
GQTEAGPGKSLQIINRQIDRMAKLVEDLLDISRLQAWRRWRWWWRRRRGPSGRCGAGGCRCPRG